MSTTPETPTTDYDEPWAYDTGTVYTKKAGRLVCNTYHSPDLIYICIKRGLRIVACVNACAGMADPAAEIEAMRAAIREAHKIIEVLNMDALDNHKENWPRANEWLQKHAVFAKLQSFIKP